MSMIDLVPMDVPMLRRLLADEAIDLGSTSVPDGALPPCSVVSHAVAQLDVGTPPAWCVPFMIVHKTQDVLLGACGFKGAPVDGTVEVLYGIAPEFRGRGMATLAVGQLLKRAVASGAVDTVISNILPRNVASSKVVAHLGFQEVHTFIDTEGQDVVRWAWRASTP